jgi:hypothetical protein
MIDAEVAQFDAAVRGGPGCREAVRDFLVLNGPSILYKKMPGSSVSLLDGYMVDSMFDGDLSPLANLLSAGMDPNSQLPGFCGGHTLLMSAAYSNEPRLVELLLRHGADPNAADDKGWTPLMFAVALDETLAASATTSAAVVRLLVDGGGHVGARNAKGHSADDILALQTLVDPEDVAIVARALHPA